MERIFVCSPLRGDGSPEAYARNRDLAIAYAREVLSVGFVPVVPHVFWPPILDDTVETEREVGLWLGRAEIPTCRAMWVWPPATGVSDGMAGDIEYAESLGIPVLNGAVEVEKRRSMPQPPVSLLDAPGIIYHFAQRLADGVRPGRSPDHYTRPPVYASP